MILQTGQRTDIPAFYSTWLINRIKEGFVLVRNPYNPLSVTKYILTKETIDLIAFCSKNPKPLLAYWDEIKDFRQFWHMTITSFSKDIEPNVPCINEAMETFIDLSERVGSNHIVWRYDPIFLTKKYTFDYHIKTFSHMVETLYPYTDCVVISFLDIYDKILNNLKDIRRPSYKACLEIGKALIEIAHNRGLAVKTCSEGNLLASLGADTEGCFTKESFEAAFNCKIHLPKRPSARKNCNCFLHGDIGAYDTCLHQCQYCYANGKIENVLNNYKQHDPLSPFIIGHSTSADQVRVADSSKWLDLQSAFIF